MKSIFPTLVLAALLLMATACATKPIALQPPSQFPDLPVSAMADVPPPPPPLPVTDLDPEQQARILLREYADALAWGAELDRLRDILIDYIERLRAMTTDEDRK